jgi:ketosteroid isomerase-like protein
MYHLILRRRTTRMFEGLGRGEWQPLVSSLAEQVHHVFPAVHPLGGERHTRAGVQRWFERLERLFPEHSAARQLAGLALERVGGRAVERATAPRGRRPYLNHGTHWLHIRWSEVSSVQAYLDTQLLDEACLQMAQHGVSEADAEPITDLTSAESHSAASKP